jgi:hypothetical protein
MNRQSYKSASRVFWIMDNCSAYRAQKAVDHLLSYWVNVVLVHPPIHASWLNPIEIYFFIAQIRGRYSRPSTFNPAANSSSDC